MMTEFLGLLIIVGAILVIVFRHQFRKDDTHDLQETGELVVSTERFRKELEHSGNEIIQRLDGHINHLEKLIVEADKRAAMLDARLHELDRRAPAELERTDAREFSQMLKQSVDIENRDMAEAALNLEAEKADRVSIKPEAAKEQAAPDLIPEEVLPDKPEMKKVKDMMKRGCSNEEISRATNIGRSAIELMRQMLGEQ